MAPKANKLSKQCFRGKNDKRFKEFYGILLIVSKVNNLTKNSFFKKRWFLMNKQGQFLFFTHTHPQCFMFWGLSMRIASLIFRSLSAQPFDTVILCSSDCLGLLGVGCKTTCVRGETIHFPASGHFGIVAGSWCAMCSAFRNNDWSSPRALFKFIIQQLLTRE